MPQRADDLASKFWDMGNYIAGFTAVHMVAFLLAIGGQRDFQSVIRERRGTVVGVTVLFNVIVYLGGVWACFYAESYVRGGATYPMWLAIACRTAWILVFTALGASCMYLVRS